LLKRDLFRSLNSLEDFENVDYDWRDFQDFVFEKNAFNLRDYSRTMGILQTLYILESSQATFRSGRSDGTFTRYRVILGAIE
jgi:hypothetical protein